MLAAGLNRSEMSVKKNASRHIGFSAVSMSLAGSRFSPESAPRPFHHGIRERGGTIEWATLPSIAVGRADTRTRLIRRPRGTLFPLGRAQVSSYWADSAL
jgi:hypothetical protein